MQLQGGWWKDEYAFEQWQEAFDTPSRKFEFYSQTIASRLSALFPEQDALDAHLASAGVASRGDDLCLPHWEPPHFAGASEEFPFLLMPRRGINYAVGGARSLPWLRELPGAGLLAWDEAIEIHPDDAQRLGVTEGDWVRVESPADTRRLRVRVRPGTRPGTLGLPLGIGPWPPKPDDPPAAGGHGLLVALSDPLAGVQATQATRVRVRREDV
jgi:anaerobic selenocysteine-containing dehydrogenase